MLDEDLILDFEKEDESEYALATHWQRINNRTIDSIVIGIGIMFFVDVFPDVHYDFTFTHGSRSLNANRFFTDLIQMMVYYSLFEFVTGRSIGKMLTRTKVVTENGAVPSLDKILLRSLCRSIPFNFLSVLHQRDAIGWHDKLSKTRVVQL